MSMKLGEPEEAASGAGKSRGTWARLRRQRVAMACLIICAGFVLALLLAPHGPNVGYTDGLTMDGSPLGSSARFLLGTDTTGPDVLSRLLFGARVSLTVGVLATLLQATLGVALGAIAGFYGGWVSACGPTRACRTWTYR